MEIIAEIGQNFNGDLELAYKMISAAKENGANVAKFQLYEAKKLFSKEGNPWYEYNCSTELTFSDAKKLKEICDDINIEFMASAFDEERVDWLEDLKVNRHKIASRSIYDKLLIDKVVKTGKPTLISLGMWDKAELPRKISENIGFLHCISLYPAPLEEVKLSKVDFNIIEGFSDHTIGITAACAALSYGAKVIEKHFTLDTGMYGPDHVCSMTPEELLGLSTFRDELKLCL
jgi:sialic acid synthase SpsE